MTKMGRPKIQDAKDRMISIRMKNKDIEKLKKCAAEHNMSMTQAIDQGLQLLYRSWENSK